MKVTRQDLDTEELAASEKSCFVRDLEVLPLMELFTTAHMEQRLGKACTWSSQEPEFNREGWSTCPREERVTELGLSLEK